VSRLATARRQRRVRLGLVRLLAVLALIAAGCRSLRVELSATGPTPAAGDAARPAAPPDSTRLPTAAPPATDTPVPAVPTLTPVATAVPTTTLAATAVPDLTADSFAPQGVRQTVSGAINTTGQKDRYRFDAVQGS